MGDRRIAGMVPAPGGLQCNAMRYLLRSLIYPAVRTEDDCLCSRPWDYVVITNKDFWGWGVVSLKRGWV